MFEWPIQMQTKPTHQIGQLSIVVVRKLPIVDQIESSTEQTRWYMRVIVDSLLTKRTNIRVYSTTDLPFAFLRE